MWELEAMTSTSRRDTHDDDNDAKPLEAKIREETDNDNDTLCPRRRAEPVKEDRTATHAISLHFHSRRWLLLLLCMLSLVSSLETEYRSYNGWHNNLHNPHWGSINSPRIREYPPESGFYQDDNTPLDEVNSNLPSARRIMEEIFHTVQPHDDKTASHMLLEFGHFMVQDILGSTANTSEPFDIPCDGNLTDYVFCPATNKAYSLDQIYGAKNDHGHIHSIPFLRDSHYQVTDYVGNGKGNSTTTTTTRATMNHMTSFLDLSNIYGMDAEFSRRHRQPGGRLYLGDDSPSESHWSQEMKSGMNTSPGAYAIYIVLMKYHNLLADEYALDTHNNNSRTDDEIFELARRKTIAVYQSMVEEKYIPTLLGDTLDPYQGYQPRVDPSIDEFFAAASFRYAHSSFSSLVRMLDAEFQGLPNEPLLLREVFKQNVPALIRENGGIEPFLRGLAVTPAKAIDASFVQDMNIWAEATSVLDVQRGRDVGLPRYNDVREAFGLERVGSMEELVRGKNSAVSYNNNNTTTMTHDDDDHDDSTLIAALKTLYHNDVDLVDAYVGAVAEAKNTSIDNMGPVFHLSLKEQFTRLRDGDRFWYKAIFPEEEYLNFPTMSQLIKLVCDDMELFPDDAFVTLDAVNSASGSDGACDVSGGGTNQLSFLGGEYIARWHIEEAADAATNTTIDVTLSVFAPMEGPGYIGIGWNARQMNGADIWFCTIDPGLFQVDVPPAAACSGKNNTLSGEPMFSCCLAQGTHHNQPQCSQPGDDLYYTLEVVDWCLSRQQSSVTVRTVVCADDVEAASDCFMLSSTQEDKMDMIVAYNLLSLSRPHGYQRRTNAQVDLKAGIITESEAGTADAGLIATHGVFMLFGWMVVAPWGVFVVRYMKTRKWRLVAHISCMGFVGSMMVPLLIGVEASVGASDKTAEHALVGLIIMGVFFLMAATGRFRYLKWEGQRIGKKTDLLTMIFHKYGGATFIALAWWNCYTGLVRIGPEDSNIELVLFSSYSMGYNMDIFGFIRQYIYGPYVAFVGVVFLVAEIRMRRLGSAQMKMELAGSLWDDDGSNLDTMTMATFLDVTRLGNSLCVVDGRVLDITEFIDSHPGGPDFLRYVRGSDITDEFLGKRDVDGVRHVHSQGAVALMKKFVKAKLIESEEGLKKGQRGSMLANVLQNRKSPHDTTLAFQESFKKLLHRPSTLASKAFRRGKVIDVRYLAPSSSSLQDEDDKKPVILLRVSLPRCKEDDFKPKDVAKIPGATFRFRGMDKRGNMFEREYTALLLDHKNISTNSRQLSLLNLQAESSKSILTAFEPFDERSNEAAKEKKEEESTFDFVISLIPGGNMSSFIMGLKAGKLLLAQGPKCNSRVLDKVEGGRFKSVVLIASGTGVVPMIQLIDYYLSCKSGCPTIFLIWILKSSAYNYHEELGLQGRVKHSRGRLKWVTFYSSSLDVDRPELKKKRSILNDLGRRSSVFDALRSSVLDPFASSMGLGSTAHSRSTVHSRSSRPMPSILWKKQKPKVKDLIAYAQHDDYVNSFEAELFNPQDDVVRLDPLFWEKKPQFISKQIDPRTIEELLVSIEACTKEQQAMGAQWRESNHSASSLSSAASSSEEEDDLDGIARVLMETVTASNHKDATGLMTHNDCFVGKEAVDCLISLGYEPSRKDGMRLGHAMLRAGLLQRVSGVQGFTDDESLFRFTLPDRVEEKKAGFALDQVKGEGGDPRNVDEEVKAEQETKEATDVESLTDDDAIQEVGTGRMVSRSVHSACPSMESIPEQSPKLWDVEDPDIELEGTEEPDIKLEGEVDGSFEDMFVAVSGSPMYETTMIEILRSIGMPRDQILTFSASSE